MKELLQWMHAHPLKSVCFAVLFSCLAMFLSFRTDTWPVIIPIYILGIILLVISIWRDSRTIPILVLLAMIHAMPVEAAPRKTEPADLGLGCAMAIVVVVVGGVVIYKVSRFCQKKFPPKDTNAPPALMFGASQSFGASWDYGSAGSCNCSDELPALIEWPGAATTVTLNLTLDEGPSLRVQIGQATGESQTFEEYQAEVASHGLFISGQGGGAQYFARDGSPCHPEAVPITFDLQTKTVTIRHQPDAPLRQVILEHSLDLQQWSEFLRTHVSDGSSLQVVDTTQTQKMFYRVRLEEP